jgi:hypothetical protein
MKLERKKEEGKTDPRLKHLDLTSLTCKHPRYRSDMKSGFIKPEVLYTSKAVKGKEQ